MINPHYNYPKFNVWGQGNYLSGNNAFNYERFQRSESGKHLMQSRSFMGEYSDVDDPALLKYWEDMGVRCEVRELKGNRWLAFVPLSAYETTEKTYPVMMIFRPVGLLAVAFYEYMIELAAQGEFIALCYSKENADDNDLYADMLQQILTELPADASRVYVTGHSHYSALALEFVRRHYDIITALVQQGEVPGLRLHAENTTEERVEWMHQHDMPTMIISGTTEMFSAFPVNQDAPASTVDPHFDIRHFPHVQSDRILCWQRRLYALRCPVTAEDNILAAVRGNKVEQVLGFPADRTDILYAEGSECYIADLLNTDGKAHFRVIAMDNIPHTTCRLMHVLTWSFLRRFAKDPATGEIIELY